MLMEIIHTLVPNLRRLLVASPRRTPGRKKYSTRLRLEVLESRTAPAVLTVNSCADNISPGSSLTLREAILLVDNAGNAAAALGRALTMKETAQIAGVFGVNDRIQFASNLNHQTITLDGNELKITESVVVDASGVVGLSISGKNMSRIFDIDNGQINAINVAILGPLTLTKGKDNGKGGAIYNSENLLLYGVTVTGNQANFGGGIYNVGTLQITGSSSISSNSVAANDGGGGIYNAGELITDNVTFQLDKATYGGAIDNYGSGATAIIDASNFIANSASGFDGGGAILNSGKLYIYGPASSFTSNSAPNGYGGAIHNMGGTTTVGQYDFNGNSAQSGGAIFNGANSTTIISGSEFNDNSAAEGHGGGALYNLGTLALDYGTVFDANQATYGGAIANLGGKASINNASFNANSADGIDGGGAILNTATMLVNTCSVTNNTSVGNGGGIANTSVLTILSSSISGNQADSTGKTTGQGSALWSSHTSVTKLHNNTITEGTGSPVNNVSGPYTTY